MTRQTERSDHVTATVLMSRCCRLCPRKRLDRSMTAAVVAAGTYAQQGALRKKALICNYDEYQAHIKKKITNFEIKVGNVRE